MCLPQIFRIDILTYPNGFSCVLIGLVGNFNLKGRNELENLILSHIGNEARGTYHFKSDGRGNTDVKFKTKEKIKDNLKSDLHLMVKQKPCFVTEE